jgi:PAS domain S-box-containing protein
VNLIGSYNYVLVALSVFIAMFASYAALDLAGRVTAAGGWTRVVWLLGGASAMGTGIWSMHYIGMLAFILPVPVAYHWPTVLLSLFAAIFASVVALGVVSRQKMGSFRALAASVLMGAGIASMHYIGMAAMRLPATCQFNSFLVVLSVVFAILISLAALWIAFHFRDEKTGTGWAKLAGAIVMGAAIPVMHYTGMAAASFAASDMPPDLSHAIGISTLGTAGIASVTFVVLGLALLTSSVDRRLATRTLEVQEEKLQHSEAYLAEAQRLSHTGSFGWKPATGEIIWSGETFRIFQYDRTTKPTVELVLQRIHSEDAVRVKQTIERASRDGKDFEHEYRLVMADGSVKHVHVVAHAERVESGEIEFIGAVMDVTGRKRAEEELRQSEALAEQRLRLVVDTTPAMINSCRPDGHLDYVNKGWLDYFGFSLETALDRADAMKVSVPSAADIHSEDWQPIIHREDLQAFRDQWKATLASGKPGEHEARIRRFDGMYRWHLFRAVPLCDETGKPVKWYASAFDIEDRKRAEALLAAEKRLLEMVARGDSLAQILDSLCRLVEGQAYDVFASILLLDSTGKRLWHGGAPSLPKAYNDVVNGIAIGPSVGSCGTAAFLGKQVIVSNIATDPLWQDFREIALAHSLRACWSTPIFSGEGKVIGTFAMYYREPRSPSPRDQEIIGQITHLAGVAIQRKLAEDALRRSEESLLEAQKLSHTGSWRHDVASGAIVVSPEIYRIHDIGPSDDPSNTESFFSKFHPEDRKRVVDLFERAEAEKTEFQVDYRIVLPDRTIKHLHTIGRPILNESGELVEFVGTAMDVTAAKRAEEALRRSEGYLAEAQRLSHTGSWARVAATGEMSYWSEECYQVLGFEPQRGLPRFETFLQRVHPDDQAKVREIAEIARREKVDYETDYRIIHPGGEIRDIHVVAHPVFSPSGDLVEFVGTVMDVTERKRAEEERERLREARADLARVNRVTTMGELTASLAHEVNQPIAAAVTNANSCIHWLAGNLPNVDKARAAAMRIVKDGTRAAEIITRIRLLFQKGAPQWQLVDVNGIIGEMIGMLHGEAARHSILVRTELAPDLPQFMGDRVQLQQVMMNLMINAIDAMKAANGTRELAIKSQRQENEHLLVSVSDTGMGLPPGQIEQIFNAFFTTKPNGTGMGLRICRSIVESHGGRLWADNNSPRGAKFCFNLPTQPGLRE